MPSNQNIFGLFIINMVGVIETKYLDGFLCEMEIIAPSPPLAHTAMVRDNRAFQGASQKPLREYKVLVHLCGTVSFESH